MAKKRRRKNKVNVKLLLILGGGLALVVLGVVGLRLFNSYRGDPDRMYAEALKAREAGDYEEARRYYGGLAMSKRLQPSQKIKYMMEFAEFLDQWIQERRGSVTREQQRDLRGTRQAQLEGVLRIQPENEQARRLFGDALWDQTRDARSVEAWQRFLELTQGHIEYLPDDADMYFRRGQAFVRLIGAQAGMYEQAVESHRAAIERDPTNIDYYESLADVIFRYGDPEDRGEVEQVYLDGIEANPGSARLRAGYALVLAHLGRAQDAEPLIEAAEAQQDKTLQGHLMLANFYVQNISLFPEGEALNRSLAHLNQARQMDPTEVSTYLQLDRALTIAGDPEQAIAALEDGLAAFEAILGGRDLNELSRDESVKYQNGVVELSSAAANRLLNNQGSLQLDPEQRLARVRQHIQRLQEIAPDSPVADRYAGWAALQEGNTLEGERLLRQAFENSGQRDLTAGELLVGVYTSDGMKNLQRAMTIINQLIALTNNDSLQIRKVNILVESAQFDEAWRLIGDLEVRDLSPTDRGRLNRYKAMIAGRVGATLDYEIPDQIEQQDIPTWLQRAILLSNAGQDDEALAVYEAILAQYPAQLNSLRSVILRYGDQGRQEEGEQLLAAALQSAPDQAEQIELIRPYLYADSSQARLQVTIDLLNQREDSPEKFLQLAQLYKALNDRPAQMENLEAALEMDPANAEAAEQLFTECISDSRFDRAEELVAVAAEHNLDQVNGELFRANLLLAQGEYRQGITACQAIIRQRPNFSRAYTIMGEAYFRLGEYAEAEQAFTTAYNQNGANLTARIGMARVADRTDRSDEALAIIREVARLMPNHPYVQQRLLIDQARTNPQDAITVREAIFERELSELPGGTLNQQNVDQLIALYLDPRVRNYDKAEQVLSQMYTLTRGRPEALRYVGQLAEVLRQADRVGMANELLSQARENNSDRVGALSVSGRFLSSVGSPTQARRMFEAAIEADPNDPRGHDGLSYWAELNREWELALSELDATIALQPDVERHKQRRVQLLLVSGDREGALSQAREYERQYADDPDFVLLEGITLEQASRIGEAMECYRRAEQMAPDNPQAKMLIAQIFIRTGRFDEAEEKANEAWRLNPSEDIAVIRVSAARGSGDDAGARTYMQEGLAEFPTSVSLVRQAVRLFSTQESWRPLTAALASGKALSPDEPYWWVVEADMWKARRDQTREVTALEEAMQRSASGPVMQRYLDALLRSGQTARVMELTADSVNNPQAEAMARAYRGRAMAIDGNEAGAMTEFLAGFETDGAPNPAVVLAQMREAIGAERANRLVEQWAVERDTWQLWYSAGQLYSSQQQLPQARQAMENALARVDDPAIQGVFYRQLGVICNRLEDFPAAERYYRLALESGEDAGTLNNLAYLLANDLGRPADALAMAQRAAEMLPREPSVADTLGWIYFQLGQYDSAEDELLRGISIQPLAALYYHLGQVYEATDQPDRALQEYELAWDLVRNSPEDSYYDLVEQRLQEMQSR